MQLNYLMLSIKGKLSSRLNFGSLVVNTFWGAFSNILQTVFVSLFFIVLARKYSTNEFALFLVASTIYQIFVAFSSMGLGQWFIREFASSEDKVDFTARFIKIQIFFGILFYLISIGASFVLYDDTAIRELSIVLGVNIVFDNILYALKMLNIAEFNQRKSSLLIVDGMMRFALSLMLFLFHIPVLYLAVFIISIRFATVNYFLKWGTSNVVSVRRLIACVINLKDIVTLIKLNWQFVVIGSISIVYWRVANIIIAKTLTAVDVVNYEVSFKIFSIAMTLPIVAASSIFPVFNRDFISGDNIELRMKFKSYLSSYYYFSFFTYSFIFSFSDIIVSIAFGEQHAAAAESLRTMISCMLIFPAVLLQANLIVAMKFERLDMYFNIISLVVYVGAYFIVSHFILSLDVASYSILGSLLLFHFLQAYFLYRRGMVSLIRTFLGYAFVFCFIWVYSLADSILNPYVSFSIVMLILTPVVLHRIIRVKQNRGVGNSRVPATIDL